MQTPKSRNCSSEVPQRRSPQSVTSRVPLKISPRAGSQEVPRKFSPRASSQDASQKISPRVVRKLVPTVPDSTSSSPNVISRTKERSPKVNEKKSPKSLGSEKRSSRVSELETRVSELQNDLKKVKDELCSTEALKNQAEQEAGETKKQLAAISSKLEESEKRLLNRAVAEEVSVTEPQKSPEEPVKVVECELEVTNSSALVSALNEIKELKSQLENIAESEATQTKNAGLAQSDLNNLKENLTESLLLVEDMKIQLRDCKEAEAQAQVLVNETLLQLETAKRTVEALRSDGVKAMELYNAVTMELDQSRAHVNLLEALVCQLQADGTKSGNDCPRVMCDPKNGTSEKEENHEMLESEIPSLKSEIESLREALEAAEVKRNEEQTRSTVEIRSAYELVEQITSGSSQREAELKGEVQKLSLAIEELKANLMDKETELQGICEENENLASRLENGQSGRREYELEKELQKSKHEIENLKANLMDKETELQNISEENAMLKLDVKTRESNIGETNGDTATELEGANMVDQEALVKLKYLKEEADKSNQRTARVMEQLDAAQASNAEMEAELRRLKVQCDQWRKAAEAAAAMLSAGDNGKFIEKTLHNHSPGSGKISPPYNEDVDEDLLKRKNANMLKRLGISWKKQQK
ncbi:PREDICTED: interactor of constitutive active ROPs 3-like [Ipomoea nil]|uniref:interactor of constitutive active ROPs 3-like n=1 Tax=Ipomoea nil TaxID=35883 RepID=UPI000901FF20|nr:PREDICTED: interactor of constitutive active ROPs 3-like [Ipomoea nil]XP_019194904.1 PREDICTED: interactor of constitutive active ROPs 3-like [Ipomoea nil]XP_019194905.1 PREDICTED: interactor of constitutive active ROPs 3-like [Ipomoea nil]XP_019194906.1 PREDICTED: interactor of constitutive active ROPs 3-like [Ipomoea nil]XP_019194907.1 PREDICTED: interactor of constitutive active ROPs 3-like [Ipomoea nil]